MLSYQQVSVQKNTDPLLFWKIKGPRKLQVKWFWSWWFYLLPERERERWRVFGREIYKRRRLEREMWRKQAVFLRIKGMAWWGQAQYTAVSSLVSWPRPSRCGLSRGETDRKEKYYGNDIPWLKLFCWLFGLIRLYIQIIIPFLYFNLENKISNVNTILF